MHEDRDDRRVRGGIGLLTLLFAVSGATSLVYETVWARQLQLIFGTSQLAICTLLAAFMAGLALGALAAARWASRVNRPLLAYAGLEAFIGLYALAFPWLMEAVEPLYLGFWRAVEPSPLVFAIYQFLLLGAVLLPPTMCMGATLPLLARFVSSRSGDVGRQVGRLYGANTIGAVVGTAAAGFLLLPTLGLSATTQAAAAANGLLVVTALVLAPKMRVAESAPSAEREPEDDSIDEPMPALLLVAAVAGFTGLLYEVAWFRLMVLLLGGSAYAFSLMLLAFLLGIGLGGWFGGAAADRAMASGGVTRVLRRLAVLQVGVAFTAWAAMYAYGELPFAYVWLFDRLESVPGLLWPAKLLLALAVMLPPALLMGAAFPFLARAASRSASDVARPVGYLYGVNTIGAVVGAFAGGFFLLPALHVRGSVLAAASFNLVAALLAVTAAMPATLPARGFRIARWTVLAIVAVTLAHWYKPPWNPILMTSGMYKYAAILPERTREGLLNSVRPYELLFYDEGLSSVVTVLRDPRTDNIFLANNGKVDASSRLDLGTQVLLAHLPFVFRPDAQRVLVIGLASGITAGSATLHTTPQRIDVVEIEPSIVAASHAFDAHNHRPLEDPRVRLLLNDARNHLQLAEDGTYDLVTCEPSNPWLTGVSSLFTQEFFELGRRKLAPTGVWAQWIQIYGLSPDDLRSLLATFADTYTHVRLFRINASDLVLVGSAAPLPMRGAEISRIFGQSTALARDLVAVGINRPSDLVARYHLDRDAILALAGDVERNTDDNMRIEYAAPWTLHVDTRAANTRLLRDSAEVPLDVFNSTDGVVGLAAAYARQGDLRRAELAARAVEEASPDDPEVAALRGVLERAAEAGTGER